MSSEQQEQQQQQQQQQHQQQQQQLVSINCHHHHRRHSSQAPSKPVSVRNNALSKEQYPFQESMFFLKPAFFLHETFPFPRINALSATFFFLSCSAKLIVSQNRIQDLGASSQNLESRLDSILEHCPFKETMPQRQSSFPRNNALSKNNACSKKL